MNNLLPITVIIPTFNRPDTLIQTIDNYLSFQCKPNEIIVIDQSCSDIQKENQKYIDLLQDNITKKYNFEIPSLARARNFGITFAHNEIIVFSDDDVTINDNLWQDIISIMNNKRIAMLAGYDLRQINKASILNYIILMKSPSKKNIGHVTKSMLGAFPESINSTVDTEWAMGFFFVVRKSLIEKWHVTWEDRFLGASYPEDLDFSYTYYKKAKAESYKCVFDNRIHVFHHVSQEYRTNKSVNIYMYIFNRRYLIAKHKMGFISVLAFYWTNALRTAQSLAHLKIFEFVIWVKYILLCIYYHSDIIKGELHNDLIRH